MLVDASVLFLSFIAAALLQYDSLSFYEVISTHLNLFLFAVSVFLISFNALGIYRTVSYAPFKHHFLSASKAYIYSIAIILSTLFLSGNLFYPRKFLILLFMLLPVLYTVIWFGVRRLFRTLRHAGYGRWNTLVIGAGKNLDNLLLRFNAFPDLGYEAVKIMKTPLHSRTDKKLHVNSVDIEKAIIDENVEIMVLSSPELNGSYDDLEKLCRKHYVRMRVVSPETDFLFDQIRIHDISGLPLFSPTRQQIDKSKQVIKRAFDIIGATILLAILSPLFLVVAVATKLESHGPVFFKHTRSLSDRDKPFMFYKFRSMHHEADEKKETLFAHNETNGALFKIKNDPRLTKVGKYIRRYSIDELPQLFNVLKGEMSLVGPRPLPIGDFNLMQEKDDVGGYFRGRSKAKPGMT